MRARSEIAPHRGLWPCRPRTKQKLKKPKPKPASSGTLAHGDASPWPVVDMRPAVVLAALWVLVQSVGLSAAAAITLNPLGCALSYDAATDYFPIGKRVDGSNLDSTQSVVRRAQFDPGHVVPRSSRGTAELVFDATELLNAAQVQVASLFQVAYKNTYKFAFSFATNESFVLYQARFEPAVLTQAGPVQPQTHHALPRNVVRDAAAERGNAQDPLPDVIYEHDKVLPGTAHTFPRCAPLCTAECRTLE